MAEEKAFLLPVVIDDTPDNTTHVPERFHDVQWTRLTGNDANEAFVQRVAALLGGGQAFRTAPEANQQSDLLPGRTLGSVSAPPAIVEGSVRKAGNRVRVTAQLIKAADGFHVWSTRGAPSFVGAEAFQLYLRGRQACVQLGSKRGA